jgi:hypothetical protein
MKRPNAGGHRPRVLMFGANLLLACVSIGLVLGLFEIGLRVAGHRPIYEVYSKPWLFWQYDPLLGWSHQPGASGEYVGPRPWPIEFRASISINSLGLRGPEIPPLGPDVLRVLFLGDSIVAAFEVSYEETFLAHVERALNERLDSPVRVINAGVRGYGSDQSYLYYRERGRKLEPDLVVLFHSRNDPIDNTTIHEMRRPFGKAALSLAPDGSLELVGHPVPKYPVCSEYQLSSSFEVTRKETLTSRSMCRAQMALFDHSALFSFLTVSIPWDGSLVRGLYHFGNPHIDHAARGDGPSPEKDFARTLGMAIVKQLSKEVARDGAQLMVIGRPIDLQKLDLRSLKEEGIEVVSLDEIWNAPRLEVSWKHDSHFNPEGHRRVAETILPTIESRLRAHAPDAASAPSPASY